MRRALGVMMLAAAAGVSVPAASTTLTTTPTTQRFGTRIVDVPVSEATKPDCAALHH